MNLFLSLSKDARRLSKSPANDCSLEAEFHGVDEAVHIGIRNFLGQRRAIEAVWLRPDAPEAVRRRWSTDYPGMGDIETCRRIVRDAGYALLGDFVLPDSAWWEHYYAPMRERLAQLTPRYAGNAVGEAVLRACREEIETYREFAEYYGYVFLVTAVDG